LRAAWSQPLLSKDQEMLGTFAIYYAEPRSPSESDLQLIEGAGHVAVIAMRENERGQRWQRPPSKSRNPKLNFELSSTPYLSSSALWSPPASNGTPIRQ
jgi:hypothetical protein